MVGFFILIGALMGTVVNSILDFVPISSPVAPANGLARLYVNNATNQFGCMMPNGTSCLPSGLAPVAHLYRDQVPILQADGSYLATNPLAGSVPDANSVEVIGNGVILTAQPTSSQPTPDYALDPLNALHVIPTTATAANWSTYEVRMSFTVLL
jgi:hypothetical protein